MINYWYDSCLRFAKLSATHRHHLCIQECRFTSLGFSHTYPHLDTVWLNSCCRRRTTAYLMRSSSVFGDNSALSSNCSLIILSSFASQRMTFRLGSWPCKVVIRSSYVRYSRHCSVTSSSARTHTLQTPSLLEVLPLLFAYTTARVNR